LLNERTNTMYGNGYSNVDKTVIPKELSIWIESKRKELNLSLRDLSNNSGVALSTLQRLIHDGKSIPRLITLSKLYKVLGEYTPKAGSSVHNSARSRLIFSGEEREELYDFCPVCDESLSGGDDVPRIKINTFKNKGAIEILEGEYNPPYVDTCLACSKVLDEVCFLPYEQLIDIIISPGPNQFYTNKEDNKKRAVTSQTTLAEILGVNQSTISRIYRTSIGHPWNLIDQRHNTKKISPQLAREIHILCAKRLVENKLKLPPNTSKESAIDSYYLHLIHEKKLPPSNIERNVNFNNTQNHRFSCDLLISSRGKPLMTIFFASFKNESLQNSPYLGIGLAFRTNYIAIHPIGDGSLIHSAFPSFYEVIYLSSGITIQACNEPLFDTFK
jgi:transcriptional regulator with XRE-family HTH domain